MCSSDLAEVADREDKGDDDHDQQRAKDDLVVLLDVSLKPGKHGKLGFRNFKNTKLRRCA